MDRIRAASASNPAPTPVNNESVEPNKISIPDHKKAAPIAIHSSDVVVQGELGFLDDLVDSVTSFGNEASETFNEVTSSVVNLVIDPVAEFAVDTVNDASDAVIDAAADVARDIQQAPAAVANHANGAIDAAENAMQKAESAVTQAANSMMDATESTELLTSAVFAAQLAEEEAAKALADANKALEEAAKTADAAATRVAEAAVRGAQAAMNAAEAALAFTENAGKQIKNEAIAISKNIKEDFVDNILLPLAKGAADFLGVINAVIARIFEMLGEVIKGVFQFDLLDGLARDILVGGIANFNDGIIEQRLKDSINLIKDTFKEVKPYIGAIKAGLDTIGSLDFINHFIKGQGSLTSNSEEYIEISDGNGNHGYLTSDEHDLLTGGGGLKDLVNKLKENRLVHRVNKVQNSIKELRDTITASSPSDVMDNVIDAIKELVLDAVDDFRNFLQYTGLGSIQFLVTGEIGMLAGLVFEIGVSIDVRQLLYFIMHGGNWDPLSTQLASLHVGYAIDGQYNPWCRFLSIFLIQPTFQFTVFSFSVGAQGGGDLGFSVAYHTSSVTGVSLNLISLNIIS